MCTDRKVIATAAEQLKKDPRLLRQDQQEQPRRGETGDAVSQ